MADRSSPTKGSIIVSRLGSIQPRRPRSPDDSSKRKTGWGSRRTVDGEENEGDDHSTTSSLRARNGDRQETVRRRVSLPKKSVPDLDAKLLERTRRVAGASERYMTELADALDTTRKIPRRVLLSGEAKRFVNEPWDQNARGTRFIQGTEEICSLHWPEKWASFRKGAKWIEDTPSRTRQGKGVDRDGGRDRIHSDSDNKLDAKLDGRLQRLQGQAPRSKGDPKDAADKKAAGAAGTGPVKKAGGSQSVQIGSKMTLARKAAEAAALRAIEANARPSVLEPVVPCLPPSKHILGYETPFDTVDDCEAHFKDFFSSYGRPKKLLDFSNDMGRDGRRRRPLNLVALEDLEQAQYNFDAHHLLVSAAVNENGKSVNKNQLRKRGRKNHGHHAKMSGHFLTQEDVRFYRSSYDDKRSETLARLPKDLQESIYLADQRLKVDSFTNVQKRNFTYPSEVPLPFQNDTLPRAPPFASNPLRLQVHTVGRSKLSRPKARTRAAAEDPANDSSDFSYSGLNPRTTMSHKREPVTDLRKEMEEVFGSLRRSSAEKKQILGETRRKARRQKARERRRDKTVGGGRESRKTPTFGTSRNEKGNFDNLRMSLKRDSMATSMRDSRRRSSWFQRVRQHLSDPPIWPTWEINVVKDDVSNKFPVGTDFGAVAKKLEQTEMNRTLAADFLIYFKLLESCTETTMRRTPFTMNNANSKSRSSTNLNGTVDSASEGAQGGSGGGLWDLDIPVMSDGTILQGLSFSHILSSPERLDRQMRRFERGEPAGDLSGLGQQRFAKEISRFRDLKWMRDAVQGRGGGLGKDKAPKRMMPNVIPGMQPKEASFWNSLGFLPPLTEGAYTTPSFTSGDILDVIYNRDSEEQGKLEENYRQLKVTGAQVVSGAADVKVGAYVVRRADVG